MVKLLKRPTQYNVCMMAIFLKTNAGTFNDCCTADNALSYPRYKYVVSCLRALNEGGSIPASWGVSLCNQCYVDSASTDAAFSNVTLPTYLLWLFQFSSQN